MSEENKGTKRCIEDESDECVFEIKGHCTDEVEFQFEEDENLYASKNLLGYVSPVFKAMFEPGFKEGEESIAAIEDFSREEFLEFLLYLEPAAYKPVNRQTYLRTTTLVDKYQCSLLVKRFKAEMEIQLKEAIQGYNYHDLFYQVQPALTCLQILQTTQAVGYSDISTLAIAAVASFAPSIYIDEPWAEDKRVGCPECKCPPLRNYRSSCDFKCPSSFPTDCYKLQNKCREIYSQFTVSLKYNISLNRMRRFPIFTFFK